MGRRISGWHARTLSQAGKEVMIKAVASALPVSAMSVFKIPKTVITSLSSALANFWWSAVEHKRKIHWISWEKMCLLKDLGGMGFKDLESFNKALLAKQAWRLINLENCLMSQVLKGKYYEGTCFVKAQLGKRPSYAWRSVLEGNDLLVQGLKLAVGNGSSLKVWTDPWLEEDNGICRPPLRKQRFFNVELQVSELINYHTRRWSRRKLSELFVPRDMMILEKNQPVISEHDSWVWRHTKSGLYSVKSGYELAFTMKNVELIRDQQVLPSLNPLKDRVWNLLAPSTLKVFIWKALSGALSVLDGLRDRGMKCDLECQTCGQTGESINHVLFSCTFARQVWAMTRFPSPPAGFDSFSIFANVNYLISFWETKKHVFEATRNFPWVLWYLWKNRNNLLFEGALFESVQVCTKAEEEASQWYAAQSLERRSTDDNRNRLIQASAAWKRPPENFVKCNIGFKWEYKKKIAGAAWVVRDSRGTVLLHSRRSFGNVESKDDAQFLSVAWAIESMRCHRFRMVYFAVEGRMLVDAINKPSDWPSFKFKVFELRSIQSDFLEWKMLAESYEANRGAHLIATSAVMDLRFQSYVARGQPIWCSEVFHNDNRDRLDVL